MSMRTRDLEQLELLWQSPTVQEPGPPSPPRDEAPPTPPVRGRAATTLLVWFAALVSFTELRPLPAEPAAATPWWIVALSFVFSALLIATIVGLGARARWGYGASLAAAAILAVDHLACPLSGHHEFGLWWFPQAVALVALTVLSVRGVRET